MREDTKPVVHALTAAFLALGMATGEDVLQRAGNHLRELLTEDVVSQDAASILEGILVAIAAGGERDTDEINTLPAKAH